MIKYKMTFVNKSFIFTEGTKIRGMLVPQRSEQSYLLPYSTRANFISVVKAKEPLGINPIMKVIQAERKKIDNGVERRNKTILMKIKKKTKERLLNKALMKNCLMPIGKISQSQSLKVLKPISLQKSARAGISLKDLNLTNKTIETNAIGREETKKKDNDENGTQLICEMKEEGSIDREEEGVIMDDKKVNDNKFDDKLDDNKEEGNEIVLNEGEFDENEMKRILEYINTLDYDKYVRDLEIREAFQLIKNKMIKDTLKEEGKEPPKEKKETVDKDKNAKVEEEEDKDNNKRDSNIPLVIKPNQITNEEDQVNQERQQQYKIIGQISKNIPKLKAVHSHKSITKLLEREGMNNSKLIDPLKIAIIKEKPPIKDHQSASVQLPFLHSSPIL